MSSEDRPNSFQPGKPYPEHNESGGSRRSIFITAALAGLAIVMLLALAVPRLFESTAANAAVVLGGGALTFAAVVAVGVLRRARR